MPQKPPKHTHRLGNPNPASKEVSKAMYETFVRNQRQDLREAEKHRGSARWAKVRKMALAKHPLCVDPFGVHRQFDLAVPAEQVHHIVGLAVSPELAYDLSNLAGLCTKCHAKVEARERLGEPTQHLFKHLNAENHQSF